MVPESGVNPLERFVTERLRKILTSKVRWQTLLWFEWFFLYDIHQSVDSRYSFAYLQQQLVAVKTEASSKNPSSKLSEADSVSGSTDSDEVKKEPKTLDSAATAVGDDVSVKTEEQKFVPGDDGDVKDEGATQHATEYDDALTSMSLNQDLEIFDGLKFEDGDVIDVNNARQQQATNADEGDDDDTNEVDAGGDEGDADADTDGAETVRLDDEEEEEEEMADMYVDDDDENEQDNDAQQLDGEELDDEQPEENAVADGFAGSEHLDDQMLFADTSSVDFSLDT